MSPKAIKFPFIKTKLDTLEGLRKFLLAYDGVKLKGPLIDFNLIRTPSKTYTANILLSLLPIIEPDVITLYDECGHEIEELKVKFIKRDFFTHISSVVVWKMIGFKECKPILMFKKKKLNYGLYFNRRMFVSTETGDKDYLPSASFILRNHSISHFQYTRVPFSWGPDIILKDFDEKLLFVLETTLSKIPKSLRFHFRGFKYLKIKHKYIISPRRFSQKERNFVVRNGFKLYDLLQSSIDFKRFISPSIQQYFQEQVELFNKINHNINK